MNDEVFWRYAHERQSVWHRRFVRRLPPPWTGDPVLRAYRLCNVHRELDRGTRVLLDRLAWARSAPEFERVFNVMLYRAYNAPDVPWVRTRNEAVRVARERAARWRAGEKRIFGAAWMITGGRLSPPDRVLDGAENWDPYEVVRVALGTTTLRDVLREVLRQPFFGGMSGWQVTLDLTYVFPHLSDDEWVHVGGLWGNPHREVVRPHGPLAACQIIDEDRGPADVVRLLRDSQEERLGQLGLNWSSVAWNAKPRLTLADVEHTLCEWHKYRVMTAGERYGRARKFTPLAEYVGG